MANVERWFADALRFQRAGDAEAAYRVGRKVLDAAPDHAGALGLCGAYLLEHNNPEGALPLLTRAAEARPDAPEAQVSLARALAAADRADEALAILRRTVADAPGSADARNELGKVLRDTGALSEALEVFREAMRLAPDDVEPDLAVYSILRSLGELAAARDHVRGTMERHPGHPAVEDSALFIECYSPDRTPEQVRAAHEAWGKAMEARVGGRAAQVHANVPDPDRPLKVGYLSPDFRKHPVGTFVASIVLAHDPAAVVPFCYASVVKPDGATVGFRKVSPRWRDVSRSTDAEAAALVRRDGIDILVDLAGLTGYNRLRVLAYRPAPVQVTYLGYPATTGLPAVDWRLTDAMADPPGTEAFYTERLARIEGGFCCFLPRIDSPDVAPPPVAANGYVTFGSLHNPVKINDQVLALWADVLEAVPGSRLLIFRTTLKDLEARRRFEAAFARRGIAPERVEYAWEAPDREHLAVYHRIDVALDCLPFCGHTTTCEALWMGVPTITLAGTCFAGRMGVSVLSMAGLEDLVATDPADYVAIARRLAGDPKALAALRGGMRDRLRSSPLLDGPGFTRRLEDAYRAMWRAWCAGRTLET
jgi:protein O-GlcNAc transferase